jgi:hypothetical protein
MPAAHRRAFQSATDAGVNLMIHRVAMSQEYGRQGLTYVRREMPFCDFFEAVVMLDALAEIRELEAERARREAAR